jgi:phage terminase large subunit-like protein
MITTTPKQTSLMRELINISNLGRVIRRGTTFDNHANLPASMIENLRSRFDGTKIGRQELYGELLDNFEDALFFRGHIEANRLVEKPAQQPWYRVVVGVDPANTSNPDSALTGIIVVGISIDEHFYVLEDGSLRGQPDVWGKKAINLAKKWSADAIILESNSGGEMVEAVIKNLDRSARTRLVRASKGKDIRAEPVAALYATKKVHHVGLLPELEDQMCNWLPNERGPSPDRMDALVWAITDLSENVSSAMRYLHSVSSPCAKCSFPLHWRNLNCPRCDSPQSI